MLRVGTEGEDFISIALDGVRIGPPHSRVTTGGLDVRNAEVFTDGHDGNVGTSCTTNKEMEIANLQTLI